MKNQMKKKKTNYKKITTITCNFILVLFIHGTEIAVIWSMHVCVHAQIFTRVDVIKQIFNKNIYFKEYFC